MSTFFRKLLVVAVFTCAAGLVGAVENDASAVVVMTSIIDLQTAPTLLSQRSTDLSGSRLEVTSASAGEHLLTIPATPATTDWSLLFCGLVIVAFIALRRLNALGQ
jgi:hypothetical protein